jgi:hypothetical protein
MRKDEEAQLSIDTREGKHLTYIQRKDHTRRSRVSQPSPKPTTSAGARPPPPQHGGRRGPWGLQATGLMPAALDRWGLQAPRRHKSHRAKSRANTFRYHPGRARSKYTHLALPLFSLLIYTLWPTNWLRDRLVCDGLKALDERYLISHFI